MRILILLFLSICFYEASAQNLFPKVEQLEKSIDTLYDKKLEAELAAFEATPQDYWMNFIPSIGLAYNLQGQPRPSFSFSLNSLFQNRAQKRQVAAVRASIILKNQIERQATKAEIQSLLQQIKLLEEDLEFSKQVFEIDAQLFEFYEKQNAHNEIKPSEFLLRKKDFLNKQQNLRLQEREISILVIEIFQISHCNF